MLIRLGLLLFVATSWLTQSALADEPLRQAIDQHLQSAWQKQNIKPAPPADDATFLRRVYLDLCGIIPTQEEAKEFLDDPSTDKRAKLIDRLLASPRYAVHQADVWDAIYFGRNPPGYDAPKREGFQRWLKEAFEQNLPYDEIARRILKAEGNTAEQGAPMYLLQYDRHPEDAAVAVSQTFLGVQLQCARCHDHPYEAWTQLDFYGMAAFFSRLQRVSAGKTKLDNKELDKLFVGELNSGEVKFVGPAKDATPGKQGEPVKPKFLLGDALAEPDTAATKEEKRLADGQPPPAPAFSRKNALADWIVLPENPYFAKALANRVWAQFFGRGLVHPIDNMSESNKPSHPELLDLLARELVAHNFDLRWFIKELISSESYQLSGEGQIAEAFPVWFERARTRPLSAEELVESWRVATGYDEMVKSTNKKVEGRFYGLTFDYVRRYFGEPNNGVGDFQGGMHEHLYLNNGQLGQLVTQEKGSLLEWLTKSEASSQERVERMFLSTLSRRPTETEQARFVEHIEGEENKDRRAERYREALWVLMTCSEFRFNH